MPETKHNPDKDHIFPINGSDFFCQFKLKNSESFESQKGLGGLGIIDFTKSSIVSLDIVDNIFEPFTSGSITVNNPFDYIEDNIKMRGDGTDILSVTLYDTSERTGAEAPSIEQRQLKYEFVVQDESNDVSKTDRSNNFKTYTLLDVDYHKLNEAVPYGKRYSGLVGDIIRQVLEEFDLPCDDKLWSPGNHLIQDFPEYIIPAAGWRYSDLIKYLLRIYYHSDGDGALAVQGILKQQRPEGDEPKGKFTLLPLTRIFSDNKNTTQEAFSVNDLTDRENSSQDNPNNPVSDLRTPVNKVAGALNNTNLTSPMTRFTNEFFVNYTVSTHDPQTGVHSKDTVVIEDIEKEWTEAFVKIFECEGGEPLPNLYLDKKDKNIYKPFVMPFRQDVVKNLATAQMVSNLIFYNLQLNIDNIGDTNRRAGRFFDIFKLHTKKRDNKGLGISDTKLLGRWLATTVRHRFFKDRYQNVLTCIKPCVGPDSFFEIDNKNIEKMENLFGPNFKPGQLVS